MNMNQILQVVVLFFFLVAHSIADSTNKNERKSYIVYMGDVPKTGLSVMKANHHSLLSTAIGDESIARESRVYSYGKSFDGFVAKLLPEEAKKLSNQKGVVSVFENTQRKLHTTRSWDFLGMTENLQKMNSKRESNLIVGVLDTGIWIKAPSFNDEGYGPVPPKWKGKCVKAGNFTGCNNKVIGARYYNLDESVNPGTEELSPADHEGHGTHTSSTVAGSSVHGASLYGVAKGTARGGVPSARLAIYKVCWSTGCSDMDLLAAFDDAIADGVDLISLSIGGPTQNFFSDPIAIGSFHAMKKGILTSCSAGNQGPSEATVQNVAPWILTVAASSLDRGFNTVVRVGNGMIYSGISMNTFSPRKKIYPLTSGALASNGTGVTYGNASACDFGTLSMDKVKGKIVYCLGSGNQDRTLKDLGAAGTIMIRDRSTDIAFTTFISATSISVGFEIDRYINSTKNPQAVIYKTTTTKITAPVMASFSSRGPQSINKNILKPDIAAPGLNILAAYSQLVSITGDPTDARISPFNIISGTSMSCPHAAAAAAYVKSFHPSWSPAAIKSALMTTATPVKFNGMEPEIASGSGQINPVKAADPGLIYDISMSSYISFLCKEGYNSTTIGLLMGDKKQYNCSSFKPAQGTDGLNYPSMHIQLENPNSTISVVFYRTVTNVGYGKTVYKANVVSPQGLSIQVTPSLLKFTQPNQTESFKVVVKGGAMKEGIQILSGSLEWSDSKHSIKSPIVVYRPLLPVF